MNSWPFLLWIWGVCAITLFGSLAARKYSRSTHAIGLLCALAAVGQMAADRLVGLVEGRGLFVATGVIPYGICWLLLCAIVEKFGQKEGHRAALFATTGQLLVILTVSGFALLPPGPSAGASGDVLAGWASLELWMRLASLMGFVTGANLCVVLYHMTRVFTSDRHLWLRGLLGPIIGGCTEAFVYLPLAFGGRESIGPLLLARILVYVVLAGCCIPWLYAHRALQGHRANP